MANEQRINDIIDIAAITKQVEATEQQLGRIVATIAEINKGGVTFKAPSGGGIPEATKQIDELGRATQKLANLQNDAGKAAYQNIQATKELIKAEQLQANATNELSGAWERARAKGQLLDKQARDLGFSMYELEKAGKKGTAEYQKLETEFNKVSKEAYDFNAEIKKVDAGINIHSKNVGNYEGAVTSLRQEIKNLTQTLATMEMQGKNNSKEYNTMVMRLGELKDAVGDVQARSKFFADDARYINTAVQAVQGLIGAYSVYVGVAELVGGKNEELEKIMRKMMALMTIMQGLQQVTNMLNKDSYVMVVAQLAVDKLRVWWTNLQAAATIKGTIAQRALNVAMKMSPVGWLVIAITALVAIISVLVTMQKKHNEQIAENNRISKLEAEELRKKGQAYSDAINTVDDYIKKLEQQGKTELELVLQSIELRRQNDLAMAKGAGIMAATQKIADELTTSIADYDKQIAALSITEVGYEAKLKRLNGLRAAAVDQLRPLNEKLTENGNTSSKLTKIINDNADAERKYVIELSKKTVGTEKQIKATKDIHKEIEDLYALLDKSITSKGSKFLDLQPQLKKQFEHIKEFNDLVLQNLGASEAEKTAALLSNEEVRYAEELLRLADNHKAIEEATKIHVDNVNAIKNGEDIKPPKDGEDGSPYDWKDYFSEIGSGANDTFSGISDLMDTLMDKELSNFKTVQDEKLRVLNERLRLGYISEEQYIADKSDLDIEYDKKKKELEKEQFKRTKAMAYAEAVINGALAAVEALNAKTTAMMIIKLAFVASALSLQLAKIQAQAPGFEKGRKDGPGTFAKVGEGGWEFTGDGTNIFKTPNSTTLTYLKPHQWVMPHNESVQLEKTLKMPGVNMPVAVKENKQNDDILNELKRLNKKPTAVVNMDAHGIRAALTQGANSMNFVNNHILFKN